MKREKWRFRSQKFRSTLTRLPYFWEEGVLLVRLPAHPGQSAPVPGDCRWSLLCLRALGSSAPLWLVWTTCLSLTQLQTAHGQRQNRVHSEARPCDKRIASTKGAPRTWGAAKDLKPSWEQVVGFELWENTHGKVSLRSEESIYTTWVSGPNQLCKSLDYDCFFFFKKTKSKV